MEREPGPRPPRRRRAPSLREPRERHRDDWYIEERWAIRALFAKVRFVGSIHDPACGSGRIVQEARARGFEASGADIAYRGFPRDARDFLADPWPAGGHDNIISNPPFGLARQFIDRALQCTRGKVALLLRLAFLEGDRRFSELWSPKRPALVLVCSSRVSMPPGDLLLSGEVKPEGGEVAFAWYVWDAHHYGPATIDWTGPRTLYESREDRYVVEPRPVSDGEGHSAGARGPP